MRLALTLLAVALVCTPFAAASRVGPEPYRRPHVPYLWEQRRAISTLLRRGQPVYCGGGRSDAVALTFDDGPGPYTAQVVELLREANAHATFFLVGNRIQYWPELPREEATVGVVGDHTWSHPRLPDLPRWLQWLELRRAEWSEQQVLGWRPRLVRMPYGRHDATTDAVARSLGLLEVFWSVDTRDDVPHAKVRDVVRNAIAGMRPGAIILMHDIHPWTLAALPRILDALRLKHLRAVSVPELLALDPPAPGQGCPYGVVSSGD
jgi:peptidoglycan/xylan/chitin deacetylase (PgdA/CDA1 family)